MTGKGILVGALLLTGAAATVAEVKSGVYAWEKAKTEERGGRVERALLGGNTLDLARIDARAVTLAPGASAGSGVRREELETMLIVKEGRLSVVLPSGAASLGPGSVAVVLPGDPHGIANVGTEPATYYQLTYRSKAGMDLERGQAAGGSFAVNWDALAFKESRTGGRRDFFDRPTAMFKRLEIHVSTLNAGLTNHATHTHRVEEYVVMLRGSARMTIGTPGHDMAAGDIVFLGANVPHDLTNTGTGVAEYFAIQGQ